MLLSIRSIAIALELGDIALCDEVAVQIELNFATDNLDFGEVPHSRLADVAAAASEVLVLAPDLLAHIIPERRNNAVD